MGVRFKNLVFGNSYSKCDKLAYVVLSPIYKSLSSVFGLRVLVLSVGVIYDPDVFVDLSNLHHCLVH